MTVASDVFALKASSRLSQGSLRVPPAPFSWFHGIVADQDCILTRRYAFFCGPEAPMHQNLWGSPDISSELHLQRVQKLARRNRLAIYSIIYMLAAVALVPATIIFDPLVCGGVIGVVGGVLVICWVVFWTGELVPRSPIRRRPN